MAPGAASTCWAQDVPCSWNTNHRKADTLSIAVTPVLSRIRQADSKQSASDTHILASWYWHVTMLLHVMDTLWVQQNCLNCISNKITKNVCLYENKQKKSKTITSHIEGQATAKCMIHEVKYPVRSYAFPLDKRSQKEHCSTSSQLCFMQTILIQMVL